ncbi:non-ribosomal peptide synthetase [Clostridium beijerinckii]|uniref:non-ribosomal peptide synthetase n=1 Tax=Clostridium beijerinckii TaxID=1520 RepID=UPI00156F6D52|nr:non-ribosomal peptide synthetase [Clostridium beijerinckii]NRY15324.1 amino acid adenylation domain-containing protein [Clostridium beijerinckii]
MSNINNKINNAIEKYNSKIAIIEGNDQITYEEMGKRIDKMASFLTNMGVEKGRHIGIYMERSTEMIIAMFGVLKAGASYVPLDPSYPEARIKYMAQDPNCSLIISNITNDKAIFNNDIEIINIEKISNETISTYINDTEIKTDDMAYIMYTSGSTGNPKGVIISHGNLCNVIEGGQKSIAIKAGEKVLLKTSICFALGIYEIFWPIFYGGTIVISKQGAEKDIFGISKIIEKNKVDIVTFVPSLFRRILKENDIQAIKQIKKVICAGEILDKDTVSMFYKISSGKLYNVYGMTELTGYAIFHECEEKNEEDLIPIGKLMSGISAFVLDEDKNIVKEGEAGELYIRGEVLSRGYYNMEAAYNEKIIKEEKLNNVPLFRTNDLVIYKDEKYYYKGRSDSLVKIRGNRVELKEIEAVISLVPGVKEAAVVASNDENKKLLAFIIEDKNNAGNIIEDARAEIKRKLPSYMYPSRWMLLEEMPCLPNGKRDNNKLKIMITDKTEVEVSNEIVTPLERFVINTYKEVLRLKTVDAENDFFEIGGDSLEILEVLRIVNEVCNVNIPLKKYVEDTRIKTIVNLIKKNQKSVESEKNIKYEVIPDKTNMNAPFQLTELQESYLFDRNSGMNICKIPTAGYAEFKCENYDKERFYRSLNAIIERHPMLKTCFTDNNMQVFKKDFTDIPIKERDLRNLNEEEKNNSINFERKKLLNSILEIMKAPLFKFTVNIIDNENAIIQMYFDALIMDGKSFNIFKKDLGRIYEGKELIPKGFNYSFYDYIQYKKWKKTTEKYKAAKEYWLNEIKDMPLNLELPLIGKAEKLENMTGAQKNCVISMEEYKILLEYAKEKGLSSFIVIFTVFSLVLSKWNRKQKFLICIPEAERADFSEEFEYMIGEFSNFLLFKFERNGKESFAELAKKNQKLLWEIKDNCDFSGTEILREIDKCNGNIGTGIVPVVFTSLLENEKSQNPFTVVYAESHTSNIYLDVVVQKVNGDIQIAFNYIKELFDEKVIEDMADAQRKITVELIKDKRAWDNSLVIDLPKEQKKIIDNVNATYEKFVYENIGDIINQNFDKYFDKVAVETINKKCTYGELKNEVIKFSGYLEEKGGKKGEPVCLLLDKGVNQVIAVLGCLWLGIPYMPLEEDTPIRRLRECIQNSKCKIIVCEEKKMGKALEISRNVINIENLSEMLIGKFYGTREPIKSEENDVFAVIHTSGSTGSPKAVMVEHKGILNCLKYTIDKFNITSEDGAIGITNLAHDMSMFDLFGMLIAGGKIVIPEAEYKKDPIHWMELIKECGVTIWNSVPAIMDMFLTTLEFHKFVINSKLRLVILGGDYLTLSIPKRLWKAVPACQIINVGGPTETTLWNIYHIVSKEDIEKNMIPYGSPIQNTKYHILNDLLEEVPIGVTGHLYCSGIGITKGYLGNRELTEERYVTHKNTGLRMYNTGDLGRFLPNGEIEFMGREDFQIKIHGKRIELGEIEKAILSYGGINSCYACFNMDEKEIIAFYMAEASYKEQKIKKYLADYLPIYMIPKEIVFVNEIPYTVNSKVDKKALLNDYYNNLKEEVKPEAFMIPFEGEIYQIYKEVLGIGKFSKEENFLMIGGDSLKAIELVNLIENKLGKRINIVEFFNNSSVKELAEFLNSEQCNLKANLEEETFRIYHDKKYEDFELSELQQAYLVGRKSEMSLGCVSAHGYLELECNDYDHDKFLRVLKKLVDRHEMLRCVICYEGNQHFVKNIGEINIPVNDIRMMSLNEKKDFLLNLRQTMIKYQLDLEDIPLVRIQVCRVTDFRYIIHVYFDTIIIDGFSYEILYNELEQLYENENLELKPLEVDFRDYILYKEYLKTTEKYLEAKNYWISRIPQLPEAATLPLLCDPGEITEIEGNLKECKLTAKEWINLEKAARERGLSTFVVLFTAFSKVIARWNSKRKILLNIPKFDRPQFHPDVNKLVGECSTFTLFEIETIPGETFYETCKRNQKQLWETEENSLFTGMEVLREIYKFNNNYGNALVPIVFSSILDLPQAPRNIFRTLYTETHTSQVWIDIDAQRCNDEIQFNWNCVKGLFDDEMLDNMVNMQMNILRQAAFIDDYWDERSILDLPETDKNIINNANDTEKAFEFVSLSEQIDKSFYEFEKNIAVADLEEEYTYGELRLMVLSAAEYLKEAGIHKGDHVAIVLDKSVNQIVYVLAAIYIGAVYVPIEYDCPKHRLKNCIEKVKCKLIITVSENAENIKHIKAETLYVDKLKYRELNDLELCRGCKEDVFAIIHTSGSTGMPKAVLVKQEGIVNCINFTNNKFSVNENDSVLALTNLAHDMSMFDIFGIIIAGGKIVIPHTNSAKDPEHWIELIKKYNISIWNSVPAMLQMLVEVMEQSGEYKLPSYRLMIAGGDYFNVKLAKSLREVAVNAKLINVGGPTETTLWNIYHEISDGDIENEKIPYGRPIDNTKYYILDENLEQLPVGVTGILYCAGKGVTKGYFNDPETVREKYLIYKDGERIYNTGDLGRYLKNGEIEFMGREDFQVKINGKRIELGEIESTLNKYPGILLSVAKIGEDKKTIYAYYKSNKEYDTSKLKEYILQSLPYYMLPKYIIRVEDFPLSRTNKIDRRQLPEINEELNVIEEYTNLSESEMKILDIAKEILKVDKIKLSDNFFLSGGDSLKAIKFSGEIKKYFSVPYTLTELFEKPYFYQISEFIKNAEIIDAQDELKEDIKNVLDGGKIEEMGLSPKEYEYAGEISYGQEGIWLHEMFHHSNLFTLIGTIDINGNVDKDKMYEALKQVVYCHDALRSVVNVNEDFEPVLLVKRNADFELIYRNIETPLELEKALLMLKEKSILIEDTNRNLFEFELWNTGKNKYKLVMEFHHAICDEGSFGIFIRDLKEAYNNQMILKEHKKHFYDYAHWERNDFDKKDVIEYWKEVLNKQKFIDIPKEKQKSFGVDIGKTVDIALDKTAIKKLENIFKKISNNNVCRLFSFIHEIFA